MTRVAAVLIVALVVAVTIYAGTLATADPEEEAQMETKAVAEDYTGKTMEEVQDALGQPVRQDRFELGLVVPEFRVELTNYFDETRRRNDPPQVQEMTWSLSPEQNLTVWFTAPEGAWTALHQLSWHPDDQF